MAKQGGKRSWVREVREMVGHDSPKGKDHRPHARRLWVDLYTIYLYRPTEFFRAITGPQQSSSL